jgi:selenocysteine lyase/cysteine desulfurase
MFSPGGFWAFEHYWAVPEAFAFHNGIGPARVTARIHELNAQVKEGLAKMPKVKLYTPRGEDLSAGIVCFDIEGMTQNEVVGRLHQRKILASTTPYRVSYARLAFGVQNTPAEVDRTLREIRALA